jgi:aminomethyltransferase
MPNENGGIVDDLIVYCLEENKSYMLVVNAANIEKDWNWISRHNTEGAEMHNISEKTGLLAIQGPKAVEYMQELTDFDLQNQKYYSFSKETFAGVDNVIISATGYTGSGGIEIYFEDKEGDADKIWEALFRVGGPKGLVPVGLGARDTLRLEKGFCLYGNDIDDTTSPLEAGLGWVTKFTKDFVGKDILARQKEEGVSRKLVGLEMVDKGIPRHGYSVQDENGKSIGEVTSGTQSPSLGIAIAMAYVNLPYNKEDTEVLVSIRNKGLRAKVVKMPFLK